MSENSKSFMSPSATTSAFFWTSRTFFTKALTRVAWAWRWVSELRVGGWYCEVRPWSPPLEFRWLAITKTVRPRKTNSPTSGLRLDFQASSAGAMRPGETVRAALPCSRVTPTAVVESPPARSVKDTRCGSKRKTWRMLPPGSPPSWSFTGSIERHS